MFLRKPQKVLFEEREDLFTYVAGGLGYNSKKKYSELEDAIYHKAYSIENINNYNGINFADGFNVNDENYTDTMNALSAVYLAQRKRQNKMLFILGGVAAVALGVGFASSYKSKDKEDICDDCTGCIKVSLCTDEDPSVVSLDD